MSETEKSEKTVFDVVEGLTEVDSELMKEFQAAMQNVVEETAETIEQRRLRAAQSRHIQLKC